jgi:glycogen debranching enzyme
MLRNIFGAIGVSVISSVAFGGDSVLAAEKMPKIEVGTFYAGGAYSPTIVVNRGAAFEMDVVWDAPDSRFEHKDQALANLGTCAPDSSYYKATFSVSGAQVTETWGKLDDHTVGLTLKTDRAVPLEYDLGQPFAASRALFYQAPNNCLGGWVWDGNTAECTPFHIGTQPAPSRIEANNNSGAKLVLALDPGKPTVVVITLSKDAPMAFDAVAPALAKAGAAYAARRPSASGDWGDFVGAISDSMNSNRYYSSLDRTIAYAVGRGWWISRQGTPDMAPYFGWDSNFNGDLGCLEDPATARDTVRAVFSLASPEGMIANYSHWPANGQWVSMVRTDPPVAALCVWKMQQRWPDKAFLAEMYPKMLKWHDWWHTKRSKPGEFLLSWGSNQIDINGTPGPLSDATLESGWDDSHSMDGAQVVGTCANIYCVDLCSLWAMDAEYLAKIAAAIGKDTDAKRLQGEHDRMCKEMNDKLWNESLGLYCNRFWDDNGDHTSHWQPLITPMNFYPLIVGAPDKTRAARMLSVLHDDKKFWGAYPIPTLAYDDPNWHQQEYWHGHTWAPVNYLIWQGLLKYDDDAHLADFTEKSVKLFMKQWNEKGICGENYRSDNGTVDDHPHYTWGALLPLIGVEALVDIGPDLKPVPRKIGLKENLTLNHVPIGGVLYKIEAKSGDVSVSRE